MNKVLQFSGTGKNTSKYYHANAYVGNFTELYLIC